MPQDGFTNPSAPPAVPGLPENFQLLTFDGFAGVNTKATRPAIADQEMSWCDNFMPLGKSNLRTLYDIGTALYTAPSGKTISYYAFGNITDTAFATVFLSDGSIVQVNSSGGGTTNIAAANTISDPTQQIGVAQWGSQYQIMVAPQTNGYFIWDGTVFYYPGTIGPYVSISNSGLDYTSSPNIQAVSTHGSGATFYSTVLSSGSISQITVSTSGSGYQATDYVMLAFSGGGSGTSATCVATAVLNSSGGVGAITVVTGGSGYSPATTKIALQGGGGTGATATATVGASGGPVASITTSNAGLGYTSPPTVVITDINNPVAQATVTIMPFGIQGTTVETFTNRVWVGNGAAPSTPPQKSLISFTAAGTPIDFSTPSGGGSFLSTDSFLLVGYHALKQSNGFLYLLGDSSVNYISGVTTTGTPPTTTFTNQNVDPQIGTPWPDTTQVYSRAIVFANTFGVHAMYGGAVQKVSTPIDVTYSSVTPTGNIPKYGTLEPSSAVAIIFGIHVYILLLQIKDPISGKTRNALLCWDGNKWFTANPSVTLTRISTQEINSIMTAWGTDGTKLYPLFNTSSTGITKIVQSKLWDRPSYIFTKNALRIFGLIQENVVETVQFTMAVDSENVSQNVSISSGFQVNWINANGQSVSWVNSLSQPVIWASSGLTSFVGSANNVSGTLIGTTLTVTSADLTIISLSIVDPVVKYNG